MHPMGQQVSFIQSNYMGFGSGLVVPGTGIAPIRGANFNMDRNPITAEAANDLSYHYPRIPDKGGKPWSLWNNGRIYAAPGPSSGYG